MNRSEMLRRLGMGEDPLEVAIQKWKDIRAGKGYCSHSSNCALCETIAPSFNGCGECSLNQLFGDHDPGLSCVGAWRKVNQSDSDRILASITNMVNCLQVLVVMYGVKKEEE